MNQHTAAGDFGRLIEPATLRIERLVPGPVDRVWAFLTDSDLRSRWLASGTMTMQVDAPFELTWRNDELTKPAGEKPAGMSGQHHMESRITELEPQRRLGFTWGTTGGVTFELEPKGNDVLLIVTHRRVLERSTLVGVSTGWHKHLDLLVARLNDREPAPFWDNWAEIKSAYDQRTPA